MIIRKSINFGVSMKRINDIFKFYSISLIALLSFSSDTVGYDETHSKVNEVEDVLIITMEVFPYGYISESGKPTGVWYDILNKIMLESEVAKRNEITPTKRLVKYIDTEKPMCTLIAGKGPEVGNVYLLEPIGQILTAGILPKKGIKIEEYTDLRNLLIAVPLGINFNSIFDDDVTMQKVSPPQYLNAIKMFSKGRVDAVAGPIPILKYIAKLQGISQAEFDRPFILLTTDVYLMCTLSVKKTIRNRLKTALIQLKREGVIQKILKRYFSSSSQ